MEIKQEGRHQPQNHCQSTRDGQGTQESLFQTLLLDGSAQDLMQPPDGNDREDHIGDDQGHFDGTELVVHRQVVEHKGVETVEIAA